MSRGNDFLVVTVGAFTGAAISIEPLPGLRAPLNQANQAGMLFGCHTVTIAQDSIAVWAVLLLLGWTWEAADILPGVGLIVIVDRSPDSTETRHQGARFAGCS